MTATNDIWRVPGPARLYFGGYTSTYNLGTTKSGLIIRPATSWKPITDDDHGVEPADWILTGKTAVIEGIFLDMAAIKTVLPYSGLFLSNRTAAGSGGTSLLGRLAFTGDASDITGDLVKPLGILEGDLATWWKADFCVPTEPSSLILSSVQENQMPFAFLVMPDPTTGKLFSTLPSYLWA